MLQLEVMLPSQFFTRRKPLPEQRLMMAVLQDAIECVEKHRFAKDLRGQRLYDEVRQWLLAEGTGWPYSFERICEVLDLDPNAVRHHLRLAQPAAGRRRRLVDA